MRTFQALALLALLGPALPAPAETPSTPITISIESNHPGATIDRHIFGQFAEHLGAGIYGGIWVGAKSPIPNTRGIRNDVVAALKALHVPDVRWPGGCFADEYHWRSGIGPADKRPTTLNTNWGGVIETNSFGTREFLDFIEQIGSEAYLSGNVGSSDPREMAEWLEYLTSDRATTLQRLRAANGHPAPYSIPFFGVGNESWGCGGSMSPERYLSEFRRFATYAKNFNPAQTGDHHMKKVASGADTADFNWTEVLMKDYPGNGWSEMDALSLHFYSGFEKWPPNRPATGFDEANYAAVLKTTLRMEELVRRHSAIMDRYDPGKKVALAVDEWGAWYTPAPGTNPGFLYQQNSERDAIVASLNLNIFARHADRVRMANIAQMINVLQAMILTDGAKMLLTPTYHVFRMYVPFQDATFIPVTYEPGHYEAGSVTLPRIDVLAARAKDGKVHVALTNLDPSAAIDVTLGFPRAGATRATGETLTAPSIDSVNTFEQPDTVRPKPIGAEAKGGALVLHLPPESVTVVELD
jgi:alpha-N-arabinofuranosidase